MSDDSPQKRSSAEMNPKKNILVCMADGSEPMDILQSVDILRTFPHASISLASPSKNQPQMVHLKDSLSISSNISFSRALSKSWDMIVLPGGNQGVSNLLQDTSLLALLSTKDIPIAAMGASATRLLPALGKVDPLGASCFTPRDCTVVVQEGAHVWTAPGLGTTTELILCVCQHVFDSTETQRVAQNMRHNYKPAVVCHVETMYCPPPQSPAYPPSSPPPIAEQEKNQPWRTMKLRATGFWQVVWPALTELGWSSDFDSSWQYTNTDKQIFGNPEAVIAHLEKQTDKTSVLLCKKYRETIETPDEEETPKRLDPLFEHVVWKRLVPLGWERKRRREKYVLMAPENAAGKRPKMSDMEVIPFLLQDAEWNTKVESLAIVDLYQQCKRTQAQMGGARVDPGVVERETKGRLPAFEFY
jgi:putative intracellular protease/amidase